MIMSVRSSVYNNFHVQVKIIEAPRKPYDGRISKALLPGMGVGGWGGAIKYFLVPSPGREEVVTDVKRSQTKNFSYK